LVEAHQAVDLGHPQVEHDDVGLRALHQWQHMAALRRLADDLEVVPCLLEGIADAVEDQLVVVCQEDP
jgi:hypothetical protein